MTDEPKTHKVDPAAVRPGHVMAFTYYVRVTEVREDGAVVTAANLDDNNAAIVFRGRPLVENARSADLAAEEVKVGVTKAAETLTTAYNRPLTVCFLKKDGTERTMRCRLVQPEPLLGRSLVEDLDQADPADRLRQVDHRTLKWVVVDGVKYTVGR